MALGNSTKAKPQNTSQNSTKGALEDDDSQKKGNDFYDIVGRIIDRLVKVVGIVPYTLARILDNFIDSEKGGIKVLAAFLLIGGVVLSSDGFFQAFGGKALFPWYEDEWIGVGWLWVWTKINFWAAVVVSLAVQWIESQAIRGKSPETAQDDYYEVAHHRTPKANPDAIDLVEARRNDYKRAGMGERSILGLFILFVFVLDFAATFFVGRNPWGEPATVFLGILIYNTCTMLAGETGFALWRKVNGKN
jgi:hypothetical protein